MANFTSSRIGELMKSGRGTAFGAPAMTYIEEKRFEQLIGRSLSTEIAAKPTTWGNLCEIYFFSQPGYLPLEVEVLNKIRFNHKKLDWSGAPDGYVGNKVIDLKSPYTLKSFCQLSECMTAADLQKVNHLYFWQLVSNAILIEQEREVKITEAELIVFVPTLAEVPLIQELALTTDLMPEYQRQWIRYAEIDTLPYLTGASTLPNVKKLNFEIIDEWKEQLTERVKLAQELKNKNT